MEKKAARSTLKSGQSQKRHPQKLIRIYALMLRLYPKAFRAAFADEMVNVFAMSLRESTERVTLMLTVCREIFDFPLNLIAAHRTAYNQLPAPVRHRKQIGWFVHIMGAALGLFLLSTIRVLLSPSYNLYAQAVPFVAALFMASVSLVLGLFWGRLGGLLTVVSGVVIWCCMTLYIYVMGVKQLGIVATVFIGLVWALPFLIFGLLFYELSQLAPKQSISV